ncbi:hypothetical protein B0H11DRAFT_2424034 [Mycena galericulata]|nr:hypothetical protein B0H11DRAFT_2424034 [Mycena galericulata]
MASRLAGKRHGPTEESARNLNRDGEKMAEAMIRRAMQPSSERDQRALCWTVKSLTDDAQLEPFIAGIPDALWGPNGRRHKYDHLIQALLDEPGTRLDHRLLDLMRHSDSDLLAPDVRIRYRISCLKALWNICTLTERGARSNLPLRALAHQLHEWLTSTDIWTMSGQQVIADPNHRELMQHLPAVQAVFNTCILFAVDILLQDLKRGLHKFKVDVGTGSFKVSDRVLGEMVRILRDLTSLYPPLFRSLPNECYLKAGDLLKRLCAGISPLDAFSWFQDMQTWINNSEDHWNNTRHSILCAFLSAYLDRSENSKLFTYQSTLEILLRGLLLPPSVQQTEHYLSLLHMGNSDNHIRHNTVLAVVMPCIFPVSATSRLPMTLHGTDILISYIFAHISDPELWFLVNSWSRKCDYAQLWKAIMAYLSAGCTGSNNTEATLEVICNLYHWLCWALSGDRLDWDVLLPWFDESDLSTLQSLPVSHALLASVMGMIRVRIWLSLVYRHKKICERLEKGDIMRVTPEFRGNLAAKLHPTSRDPHQELAIIPMFPTNSQNMDLTQGDWDESHSFLSHPLLSESDPGKVSDSTDPNFDFGTCDDNLERAAHYLNLLDIISRRFSDAMVVFYAEFLEACSSETLPYLAQRTLECTEIRGFGVFSANGQHQIRFANSVHAFMKARATSSDHTQLWERFILRSSILEYSLKRGTPYFCILRAQDGGFEPVAAEILRNSLNEYADSIKGSPDTGLELAVQKILDNLEGFSKTPPASIQ